MMDFRICVDWRQLFSETVWRIDLSPPKLLLAPRQVQGPKSPINHHIKKPLVTRQLHLDPNFSHKKTPTHWKYIQYLFFVSPFRLLILFCVPWPCSVNETGFVFHETQHFYSISTRTYVCVCVWNFSRWFKFHTRKRRISVCLN